MHAICSWTFDLPSSAGDPTVTVNDYGHTYLGLGVNQEFVGGPGGCVIHAEVLNGFGGAGAPETLNSGNCNTDGYTSGESHVQVVNSQSQYGPWDVVASFNSTVTSFLGGYDVFYGIFRVCAQNPVGQHNTYLCSQFEGGPLF